jgi:hypothetical protein
MPSVSVIVPAYNQSRYLGAAIRSALVQTRRDLDVLVVDDGSTDDTREVVTAFTDPRVKYIFQQNRGLSAARNTGLEHATGEFVTFLDSDDEFLPEKLETLLEAFERDPSLGMAAGQAVLIDQDGHELGEVFDRPLPAESSELLLGNPLHVGSVLLRRSWQQRVGVFDETLRSYEDWDMWLRLARAGCPMAWVPRPVSRYRFHQEQMTRIGTQMTTATFAVLEKTYASPDLPLSWVARRDEAYSRAFLRAAAQSYLGGDAAGGCEHMRQAVHRNPALAADGGERLAGIAAGWANHAKTRDPLGYLERFYDNLPEELAGLRQRRRRELAEQARRMAFGAEARGALDEARSLARRAVGYRPAFGLDRALMRLALGAGAPAPGRDNATIGRHP